MGPTGASEETSVLVRQEATEGEVVTWFTEAVCPVTLGERLFSRIETDWEMKAGGVDSTAE